MARAHPAIGSVEGTIEAGTIRGGNGFAVRDPITGRRIECRCGDRETLARAAADRGKRVYVRGLVRYDADGWPVSVIVESLGRLGDGDRVQPEDLRGLFADDPVDLEEWARYVRED